MTTTDQVPTSPRVTRRRILRWTATVVVVAAVGYFFVRTLQNNWSDLQEQDLSFRPVWLVSMVCFAAAVPVTGWLWKRILLALDPTLRISNREAVAVQCASWLLKYIPGQVGSVVNKIMWAAKRGIGRTLTVISFIYENVFLQVASIIPSVAILLVSLGPQIFGDNATLLLLPLLVLVPLGLVLYGPFFHATLNFVARRALKREIPKSDFLSTATTARMLVEFLGPRVLNGIGFVLIAGSVAAITPAQWLPFAAAYVLAGAIGILAVFVPSGLGVREAVIVLILSQYISAPEAIIISLLARVFSTLGDVVIALIYLGTRQRVPEENPT